MAKKPFTQRLKAVFATAVLGALPLPALAQAVDPQPEADTAPLKLPAWGGLSPQGEDTADRRRLDQQADDFFDRKFKVYVTRENIFIGQPARHDFPLIDLPDDSGVSITRQYLDLKPMRKEWYGRASGVGYGIDLAVHRPVTALGAEWHMGGGMYIGAFDSPYRHETRDNSRNNVEGSTEVRFGNTRGNMVLGVSYGNRHGPDIDNREEGARLYQQIDFPALFNSKAGDTAGIGRFSGMVKTYVGTDSSGAEAGIYFNDLKNSGKGVNYSIGPEVRYDTERGTSVRLRVRIAPKWF
jgi:hypothetical protein